MSGEILYGIGALILLGALIWGVSHYRLKSRRAEALSQEATREEYEEPEQYDAERRDELRGKISDAEQDAETQDDGETDGQDRDTR